MLKCEQRFHHAVHVYIAFEVVRLEEIAFCVALCAAQVHETDPVAELLHHRGQFVVRTHAERTGAEAQSVGLIGYGGD